VSFLGSLKEAQTTAFYGPEIAGFSRKWMITVPDLEYKGRGGSGSGALAGTATAFVRATLLYRRFRPHHRRKPLDTPAAVVPQWIA
jgi:hypothetical protein